LKSLFKIVSLVAMAGVIPASAAILTSGSQLNLSGAEVIGTTFVNFSCNQPGDSVCVAPPVGLGDFAVANSTGSFSQYNGTFGLIASFNNTTQPLNTSFSLPNFITFNLNNQITIELTFLPLGNDTVSSNCAGVPHCTPAFAALITLSDPSGLSAFNLDQSLTGTAAVFGISGTVHASDGSSAPILGTFSTTLTGLNTQQALAALLGGSPQTYQGNLVLGDVLAGTVPEPVSMVMVGLGLVTLVLLRIKKGVRRAH
jgi:hypothetical protein